MKTTTASVKRFINDVFGNNNNHEFRRDIGIDGRMIMSKHSVQVYYMVNPKRITIKMPSFSVPYFTEDRKHIGEMPQQVITFEPNLKDIAEATAEARQQFKDCCFSDYIGKIIDIGVKAYETRYGTIRN